MTPYQDWRKNQKPHISPSAMDMYFRCGEQYRRRYIENEKIPPAVALLKGRAVHKAAEVNYREKMKTGEDLPEATLLEAAGEEFESTYRAEGLFLSPEEESIGSKKVLGEAMDSSIRLTSLFRHGVAPRVDPAIIEQFIRVELPKHSHDLLGRIDVVDKSAKIRDLKTSTRRKPQSEIDSSDQMTFYHVAYERLTGKPAAGVVLDVLVDKATPEVQTLEANRGDKDRAILANRLNAMLNGIKAGVFLPATPGHWCCSPRFCGYWPTCPFVNAERTAAAAALA